MSNKFHLNQMARSAALGEVFYEESGLSTKELMYKMGYYHDRRDHDLPVFAGLENYTGADLMKLVEQYETGYKNLMLVAYEAGKEGKVIV